MAIKFSLKKIDARLDSMKSKKERLAFLRKYLFGLEKQLAEFNVSDARELERLKPITQADFEKYHSFLDAGKLISIWPPNDRFHADKFQNIGLLRKRKELEHWFHHQLALIQLFESKLKEESERPANSFRVDASPKPETFNDLFTSPHWADCFKYALKMIDPPLINDENELKPPHGTKGIIPIVIDKIRRRGGMQKHSEQIQVEILNKTFPFLNLAKDASEFRKSYKKLDERNVAFDIESLISHFVSHFPEPENPGK